MKNLRIANQNEISEIKDTLRRATKRDNSDDLLCGFPRDSTQWYFADLEDGDLENLFLFWDGSAWGESADIPPRKVEKGLKDFVALREKGSERWTVQLRTILEIKNDSSTNQQPFLILIGKGEDSPLMILDGNHHAVSALWQADKTGSRIGIPTRARIGLSLEMPNFPWYRRIENRAQ